MHKNNSYVHKEYCAIRLKFSGNLSIDLNGYIIRIITIRIKTIKERVVYERVNSLSADV